MLSLLIDALVYGAATGLVLIATVGCTRPSVTVRDAAYKLHNDLAYKIERATTPGQRERYEARQQLVRDVEARITAVIADENGEFVEGVGGLGR